LSSTWSREYRLWPAAKQWSVAAGASLSIAGKVFREPTFEGGLVKIEAQELPDGMSCKAIDVAADATDSRWTARWQHRLYKGATRFVSCRRPPIPAEKRKIHIKDRKSPAR
jgi:hypothetical protein